MEEWHIPSVGQLSEFLPDENQSVSLWFVVAIGSMLTMCHSSTCPPTQDLFLECCFQLWSIQGTKNCVKSNLTAPPPLPPRHSEFALHRTLDVYFWWLWPSEPWPGLTFPAAFWFALGSWQVLAVTAPDSLSTAWIDGCAHRSLTCCQVSSFSLSLYYHMDNTHYAGLVLHVTTASFILSLYMQ